MLHYLNTLFQVYPRITKMAPQPKQENRSCQKYDIVWDRQKSVFEGGRQTSDLFKTFEKNILMLILSDSSHKKNKTGFAPLYEKASSISGT